LKGGKDVLDSNKREVCPDDKVMRENLVKEGCTAEEVRVEWERLACGCDGCTGRGDTVLPVETMVAKEKEREESVTIFRCLRF
jgi:hypothetical protein